MTNPCKIIAATLLPLALLLLTAGTAWSQSAPSRWTQGAPIPQGAEEVYGVAAGGKMYVFGGLAPGWKSIGMVMEYDPASNAWTRKKDMPAYQHHVAVTEHNGKIYTFGGYKLPDSGPATWIPLNTAWEYDPKNDSWRALAPVPQARGSANAVAMNGKIHLIGGATLPFEMKDTKFHPNRNVSVGTHEVYDIASNSWSTRSALPTPRNHAAAGLANGKIYIVGGRAGSVFIPNALNVDIVEEYDPATDQWQLKAPMPTPRSAAAWGVHNGKIVVAGGEIRHRDFWGTYTTVESYDPATDSWSRLAPMPLPRHGLAGGVIGDRLHLISGSVQSGTNVPGLATNSDRHDILNLQ
ncbi:MAG: kelch repeat-containing protein [Hylemonella sp.]|nr:kelch repeat-containing protein [Hylemonella sp.]